MEHGFDWRKAMLARMVCLLAVITAFAGCAGGPPAPGAALLPWQDTHFAWNDRPVTPSPEDIFRLDPQLARMLDDPGLQRLPALARTDRLVTLIFGPKRDRFQYESGHTSTATESWRRRRGDCISLTVLAYAAARALRLDARIQEVETPALYVRSHGFELVNHHVNLIVDIPPSPEHAGRRRMTIDFDPDGLPGLSGRVLSQAAVVARVYSNLAAESLTAGQPRPAYAYLKAAILADPAHAASYANLAVLYRREGFDAAAEQLLRSAIALDDQPETAMHALLDLLQGQGRTAEAQQVAQALRTRQEADPHYWIQLGSQRLAEGRPAEAVRALERAQALSDGFSEVHRQLITAYLQLGKREKAREQMALLAASEAVNGGTSKLKAKPAPR
jgi:tetratricopeptide (TPR) repeat protein